MQRHRLPYLRAKNQHKQECLYYFRLPIHHRACDVRKNNCPFDTEMVLKQ